MSHFDTIKNNLLKKVVLSCHYFALLQTWIVALILKLFRLKVLSLGFFPYPKWELKILFVWSMEVSLLVKSDLIRIFEVTNCFQEAIYYANFFIF